MASAAIKVINIKFLISVFIFLIRIPGNKIKREILMIILLAEIVGILDDIHSKGIADRYLKPENLMISKNDHLKLIDYGTSVMVHETK